MPIQPDAQAVHGITDDDIADVPRWAEVVPRLLEVTAYRQVLCYNADYDAGVVRADTSRAGISLGHLPDDDQWGCVVPRRSDWTQAVRWLPLDGGHRALGDTRAAREALLAMTVPRGFKNSEALSRRKLQGGTHQCWRVSAWVRELMLGRFRSGRC